MSVDQLLGELTLEEKAGLVVGADLWHTPAVERLGIGAIRMTDGPAGARGTVFEGELTSALFPSGACLAATADPALVERVGVALALEAKAKGAHVLLAPTLNLVRHPLAGRAFECFGEDPDLSAELAAAFVRGVQSEGVAACPKHLVANDQETGRTAVSVEVDEAALRAAYLRPFEAALVEAGAWTCMSAYNRLNGVHCTEDPWLLTTLLRDEWGWDGVVVSDWGAVHSTARSLAAGCDLEMPGPGGHRGPALVAAVEAGDLDVADLDRSVRRILVLADRVGVLGAHGGPPASAAERSTGAEPGVRSLLREVAAAGTVLLHDDGGILPLAPGTTLAVVGPNAARLHAGGGGSASVRPPHVVSPVEGLAAAGFEVVHEPGCPPLRPPHLDPHRTTVHVDELGPDGSVASSRACGRSRWFSFGPGHARAGRMRAEHLPSTTGRHVLRVGARGSVSVRVDGREVFAGEVSGRHELAVDLDADRAVAFEVDVRSADPAAAWLDLRLAPPATLDDLERAVAAAATAAAAVVVVGLDDAEDTEGRDRRRFPLAPEQVQLVEAVVAAQPRTVVVVNAGSPVDLPWAGSVPCLLFLPPPGQEGGAALADVLTGAAPAGGRLPFTIPVALEDLGSHPGFPGDGQRVVYVEGPLVGHRWLAAQAVAPRFGFGHPVRPPVAPA